MDQLLTADEKNSPKGVDAPGQSDDAKLSYLGLAAASVYDTTFGPGDPSKLSEADLASYQETRTEVATYAGGFAKTACLFLRGRFAMPLTMASYAFDQAKPLDPFETQLLDGGLGMAKGAVMRKAFSVTAPIKDHALKGVALGITSRAAEVGFDRHSYFDKATGEFSLTTTVESLHNSVFNKNALAVDLILLGASSSLLRGTDLAMGGRVTRSPLVSNMVAGGTFGLTSGALEELQRQRNGEDFDAVAITKRAFLRAGLDSVAAIPGGLQARSLSIHLRSGLEPKPSSPTPQKLALEPLTRAANQEQTIAAPAKVIDRITQLKPAAETTAFKVRSNSGDPVGELMSNFPETPFCLGGRWYSSVEGFYTSLKFSQPEQQAQAAALSGSRAKNFGRESKATETVYEGQTIKLGSPEHHELMKRAIRAKLEQNPDLDRAFAETYPRPIEHPLKDRAGTRFPGEQFTRILADLRFESLARHPELQQRLNAPKVDLPPREPVPLITVTEALSGVNQPHLQDLHNLPAYAKAFEGFDRRVSRVIGGGADSVLLHLQDGNVLKITTRTLEPNFGQRWFDLPILETGSRMVDGKQVNYFVQPFAREAKPAQVEQFLKDLESSGHYMRDYNPLNVGWYLPENRPTLVDPWSVERIPGK